MMASSKDRQSLTSLDIRLFGGFAVQRDGQTVQPFRSHKARALFIYLVLQPERAHARTWLAALLWPDAPPDRAAHNLRQALTFLRKALKLEGALSPLHIDRHSVRFTPNRVCRIDVVNFTQHIEAATMDDLAEAVSLYRGPLLEGFYLDEAPDFETWLVAERERLQMTALGALDQLAAFHHARGEYDPAQRYLHQAIAIDAWHEQAYRGLMRVLALQGDVAGALAQYERCREALQSGLGVEPIAATQALYEQIRAGEHLTAAVSIDQLTFAFVGRGAEHARLATVLAQSTHHPRLFLLAGELGMGKSRLMMEFGRYASSHAVLCLAGRCLDFDVPVPYQPVAMALRDALSSVRDPLTPIWLAELSRLLPELSEQHPDLAPMLPDATDRQRLFTAVAKLLENSGRPDQTILLMLDDLHWADSATLDLLHFLMHHGPKRLLILGAYRPEDTPADHPLTRLRRGLIREWLVEVIDLLPLDQDAIQALANNLVTPDNASDLAEFLSRESEGNAFVMTELLHDLIDTYAFERGAWQMPSDWIERAKRLTTNVREVILGRVERLSAPSLDALRVASAMGSSFDLMLLSKVITTQGEALATYVIEWQQRYLVRVTETQIDFAHDKIRDVLYAALPEDRRRELHGTIARALMQIDSTQAADLAHHFFHSDDPAQALPYLHRAAQQAAHALAFAEAVMLCSKALELNPNDAALRFELLALRQRAYQFLGQVKAEGEDALALVKVAEASGDPRLLADAVQRLGRYYYLTGQVSEARQVIEEVVNIARRAGDVATALRVLNMLAMLFRNTPEGQVETQRLHAEALRLARDAAEPRFEALLLSDIAVVLSEKGEYAQALESVEQGVALLRSQHERSYLPHALYIQAGLYRTIGQYELAARAVTEALALCQELNIRTYLVQICLEQGKLALNQRQLETARQAYEQVMQQALQTRRSSIAAKAHLGLGQVAYHAGDFALAYEELMQSIVLCDAENIPTQVLARSSLALVHLELDDVDAALKESELAVADVGAGAHMNVYLPRVCWSHYCVLRACGQIEQGRSRLKAAYDRIMAQAEQLPQSWRESFLTLVPLNQQIVQHVEGRPDARG